MRINELLDGIAEVMEWTFGLLESAGNNFNWLLMAVGFIMMVWWVGQMGKYNREAKDNGTLK